MSFSEDLLNHFVGSLLEDVTEIKTLWFNLDDGSFTLNIHGFRYVDYAIQGQFRVGEVQYSSDVQTIVFHQLGATTIRGRFWMGEYLSYLVDEPLKDYLGGFDFVSVNGSSYTFKLRETETMQSFFDTELTGHKITDLFPIDDLLIRPNEIAFVAEG
jgi:hypothetical protein